MTTTASEPASSAADRLKGGRVVTRIEQVRAIVARERAAGARVALVPTMGALHEGHLRLLDAARREAGFVVMSIFVNPLQFGADEDLARYPRDTEGDIAKARGRGADLVFLPAVEEMYPAAARTMVAPVGLDERWEGAIRPGHFRGVLTVVAKLFNIVLPDVAVFGQKDAQQVAVVRAMVRDLDFPVRVLAAPTVREPDGLALSSRNVYLSGEDRARALALSRALGAMQRAYADGMRSGESLLRAGRAELDGHSVEPDYLAIVDPASLESVSEAVAGSLVLVAARIGATRLIDNAVLGAP